MKNEVDKACFLKYVERLDPDVICLQETWLAGAGPNRCASVADPIEPRVAASRARSS
jgi:exonuclease III|tara:strand:+ start:465 stop:635 length:171 start_codon:yes stop_codon:yes gene_type:complete